MLYLAILRLKDEMQMHTDVDTSEICIGDSVQFELVEVKYVCAHYPRLPLHRLVISIIPSERSLSGTC